MISIQSLQSSAYTSSVNYSSTSTVTSSGTSTSETSEASAVYEHTSVQTTVNSYQPDLKKIQEMKEESDRRMIALFKQSIEGGTLKQAGGLKKALETILKGERVEGFDFSVTPEDVERAKSDIAEGGYYSAQATSDRFLDFAKALSGGDKTKADQLIEGFKKGYEAAEKIWGGELPEISKQTYELTLEKFDQWVNE